MNTELQKNTHNNIRELIAYDTINNGYIVRHDYELNGIGINHQYIIGNKVHINKCREKTTQEAQKLGDFSTRQFYSELVK